MVNTTAALEIKPSQELIDLFKQLDQIAERLESRLSECERVLIEICDREGIAFNIEHTKRERVARNVTKEKFEEGSGVLQDGSMPERMRSLLKKD